MFKSKQFICFLPAACLVLITGAPAKAGFIYSTVPSPASSTFGGSTVTFTGVSSVGVASTPTLGVIFRTADASTTAPPATDLTSIAITDTITITNIPPAGTAAVGTISVTGTLQFFRSDSGGEVSTFTPSAPAFSSTIGGVTYTISSISYAGPTVNNTSTATSALFSSTAATPEPASFALMGLGLAGLAALRRR